MGTKIDGAVAAAFAGVEHAEMACQAFEFAAGTLPMYPAVDVSVVRNALAANLAEQYRRLFMWSTFTVDDEARGRAKELAMRRFLAHDVSIMGYLDRQGMGPGSWFDDDEKAFRDEIAALVASEVGP